jgi:hypothetical protein
MNPRQASALALVGWYLMVPHTVLTGLFSSSFGGSKTPNSDWDIQATFGTSEACEAARAVYVADPNNNIRYRSESDPMVRKELAKEKIIAECIATDDPRLKGK